jgi:hypothetical protein
MNCANEPQQETREEDISSQTCQELIHKYESIVYDYLAVMNSSETVKSMDSAKYTIQLGLTAITHIYKLAFCLTKNVATAADHCQKGIYCFIEYIEQTYKLGYAANSSSNLFDFMDAVAFIYDKTISDLKRDYDGGLGSEPSSLANILSVSSKSNEQYDSDILQCKLVLDKIGKVVSVLVWFNHPGMSITDQMEIVDSHLIEFLEYLSSQQQLQTNTETDICLFLETIQDTVVGMDKKEYCDFLCAIKKQMKKRVKNSGEITNIRSSLSPVCLYLKTMRGMTLKEMIEQEKWKHGVNDLAKLGFC